MAMNGIDISSHQMGINLSAVPADFVICKATQGNWYTSPDCVRQVEQAMQSGKCVGVYHYIDGRADSAEQEVDYFINSILNWIGKAVICLDWEHYDNTVWGNNNYLEACIKRVIARTGIKPVIYASQSVFPWNIASKYDCGRWVAQYADGNATGYQDTPWNEGAYACAIRQYSSNGTLSGYSGRLDLNKFYGDRSAWSKYATGGAGAGKPDTKPVETAPTGTTLELAYNVMLNHYGVGDARKKALGTRYQEVQDFLNHIDQADTATLVTETKAGKYGNDPIRRTVLDDRYHEVQDVINGGAHIYYKVKAGDTLSGIASKYGTTYQHLAQINGISNPNIIYAGQTIRIK